MKLSRVLVIVGILSLLAIIFGTLVGGVAAQEVVATNQGPEVIIAPSSLERLSWGAILAGAIIAIILQLALNLLGIGIGFTSITPADGDSPEAGRFAVSAAVWIGVSVLISLAVGGWIAGRFAGIPDRTDGLLHGLITWGVVMLFTLFILTSSIGRLISGMGHLIGQGLNLVGSVTGSVASGVASVAGNVAKGAANVAGSAASTVASTAQDVAQNAADQSPEVADALERFNLSTEGIQQEALNLLRSAGIQPEQVQQTAQDAAGDVQEAVKQAVQNPGQAEQTLSLALRRAFRRGQGVVQQADRDSLMRILQDRGVSEEDARRTVEGWEANFNSAREEVERAREQVSDRLEQLQEEARVRAEQARVEAERVAREATQTAAQALSRLALAIFAAIIVGALAGSLGGALGAPDNVQTVQVDTSGE